ncbi:MAG: Chemotaxis protein methyltransferase CheR [bacterium]|nr:Chemotaxis protein methyltransferase CheR [bacterium]
MMAKGERARSVAFESGADETLATVAHELRAPLNAIAGWAKLLEEGSLSPEQTRRAIATILRSAAAQGRLIEDLIDTTRSAYGGLRVCPQRIDVEAVVSGAVATIEPLAEDKWIRIDARVPQPAIEIWGDLQRLQQVLCNLLVNAVKFSPTHSNVELQVERRDSFATFRVRDKGIGIRTEFLPYIFERFRSDDHRYNRGLGLGLAIARHIVELHTGTITAHSDGEGRGATFTVELPACEGVAAWHST